jgi:hypothetical protein
LPEWENHFRNDKDIMVLVIKNDISTLNQIWSELKIDEWFLMELVQEYWYDIIEKHLSEESKSLPQISKIREDILVKNNKIREEILAKRKEILEFVKRNWRNLSDENVETT